MSEADSRTPLLLGFHCHQPVGNFDSVLRRACADCYGPLLAALAKEPSFRFSLHISGCLLEWMEKEERGVFDLVRRLARRGQAELLTSGFYEPILSSIPRRDARGQLRLFGKYLGRVAGCPPRGLWLTERVWEPSLVPLLAGEGVEYAIVDDNHLRGSAFPPDRLGGHFTTAAAGERLALFPISQRLRYLIPFHPVPEVLAEISSLPPGQAAVIFDDGEKFGLWPGTAEWVFGEGWLAGFLAAVAGSDRVTTMTFGEYLDTHPPLGRVVVPPASYREMEEWSLAPDDALSYRELAAHLEGEGRGEQARRFLRGGTWEGFALRYPECARLREKMLAVSRRLAERDLPRARRHLYRGQCNDAYWHGIFGGLYLPVLRDGVTRALNEAERELDLALGLPEPALADHDGDGHPEATWHGADALFTAVAAPGGQVVDLSDKESLVNLAGCVARREELYHRAAAASASPLPAGGGGGAETIHGAAPVVPPAMREALACDWHERTCFIDHFFGPGAGLAGFARCENPEWGDFVDQPYRLELTEGGVAATREGGVYPPGCGIIPFAVKKEYRLAGRCLTARYRVRHLGKVGVDILFAVEVNFHLPSGERVAAAIDGRPFALGHPVEERGRVVALADTSLVRPVIFKSSREGRLWSFPVRTVARSEEGFDLTFQGSSFAFVLSEGFAPGREVGFTLSVSF